MNLSRWVEGSVNGKVEWRRRRGRLVGAHPNNGMHPTADSAAFIRKTWVLVGLCARRVMQALDAQSL